MAGGTDSTRAILFALGANFTIACAKGVAAFFTGTAPRPILACHIIQIRAVLEKSKLGLSLFTLSAHICEALRKEQSCGFTD